MMAWLIDSKVSLPCIDVIYIDLTRLPLFQQSSMFSTSVYYSCHFIFCFFFSMSLSALLLLSAPHVLISGLGDERSQWDKWQLTEVLFTNLPE